MIHFIHVNTDAPVHNWLSKELFKITNWIRGTVLMIHR